MQSFDDLIGSLLGSADSSTSSSSASSVFQSIILSFLFVPRVALRFAFLAANGLAQKLSTEIEQLDEISLAVRDLGNPVYSIGGTEHLVRARTALLRLEQLPKVTAGSPALGSYKSATRAFLENELSKNVGAGNARALLRSSDEAAADVTSLMSGLSSMHADVLERLYKLVVGVENFQTTPFQTVLGNSTVLRIRQSIEAVLSTVEDGTASSSVRSIVMSLISGREVLDVLSNVPALFGPVLPQGATASTGQAPATVSGSLSSVVLDPNPTITITVGSGPPTSYAFFIGNAALLVSEPIHFPVDATSKALYLTLDSGTVEIPFQGTFTSIAQLAAAVNAAAAGVQAVGFANYPDRLLLYSTSSSTLSVSPYLHRTDGDGTISVWAQSAHDLLGLSVGQEGTRTLPVRHVVEAINSLYANQVVASARNGVLTVATTEFSHGISLQVDFPGFSGSSRATSNSVLFDDSTLSDAVQVGDLVMLDGVSSHVVSKTSSGVLLEAAVPTVKAASIQVKSRLEVYYAQLDGVLQDFYSGWVKTKYSKDLTSFDRVIAPLFGNRGEAHRNTALQEISALREKLDGLRQQLLALDLPSNADRRESDLANSIVETLRERKYDRAADLLLKCDLASLITIDEDSASYAGTMLKATETFAQKGMQTKQLDGETGPDDEAYSTGRAG